jgi:hypothetical protein
MNYAKPKVAVLGDASVLIENSTIKTGTHLEFNRVNRNSVSPAYDLDE